MELLKLILAKTFRASLCTTFQGAGFGSSPDGQAECNLVHEVSEVVDQVQHASLDASHQVSKEVAKGVDGPANGHDEAHGLERGLHVLVHSTASSHVASLTCKDLEQDVAPSTQAKNKAQPSTERTQGVGLTAIAEGQHANCAEQQAPEHACAEIRLHCHKDQVELNHLQWDSD